MTPQQEAMAVLYRDVAAAWQYPMDEVVAALRAGVTEPAALRALDDAEDLAGPWEACHQALLATSADTLRLAYGRLFVGQDPCFLNEGDFRGRAFDRPNILADVMGFYHAFGVDPSQLSAERPDFLGTELEFVALLHVKEGLARDGARPDQAAICEAARRRFVEEHLTRWAPAFCAELRKRTHEPFYLALATMLDGLLARERALTSVA
ncbi:MAG: molecular chaperone TorD family protein [Actinobacteria bacterium]|nr:molecular chaperone TorD family protein [Actinomycetota bacterium]